jgi:hypothetical protein
MPTKSSQLETSRALTKTQGSEQKPPPPSAMLLKRALPPCLMRSA